MKHVFAVIAGLIIGGVVNMGLIMASGKVIPPPAGVDVTNMESLKESMHLFAPRHFIIPFLAHALGTLVGALVASKLATSHNMGFAFGIGAVFMIGGVVNACMLPAPVWFIVLDLVGAYIPMAWCGGKLATMKRNVGERRMMEGEKLR